MIAIALHCVKPRSLKCECPIKTAVNATGVKCARRRREFHAIYMSRTILPAVTRTAASPKLNTYLPNYLPIARVEASTNVICGHLDIACSTTHVTG